MSTPGMPTDAEIIRRLRERLAQVEAGIEDYMTVAVKTGELRQAAWERLQASWVPQAMIPEPVRHFLDVFERTLQPRHSASVRLGGALRTDWTTAVLCDPDMTDEQRAHWLAPEEGEGQE